MDGVLIDSEPLWRDVEMSLLGGLGVPLTEEMCMQTMGFRVSETVAYWYARFPWSGPDVEEVTTALMRGVIDAIRRRGEPKDGTYAALDVASSAGLRLAIASSSYYA